MGPIPGSTARMMNAKYFEQAPVGASLRVAGRLSQDASLTATDGGILALVGPTDGTEVPSLSAREGFVVVDGRKEEGGKLVAHEVQVLGDKMDVEMWNGMVEMTFNPQLSEFFTPAV